jgi:tRNA pseudouridine32 synthase/23S rRNA pseudouridine746 synthase/23S rRNA pseudouridine1911/1915/1917 synthase
MPEVLFEDEDVWVYDKPSGISLLRDRSGASCLWDELVASGPKPYLVHRLDKGTSGCLIVAKHQTAQSHLTRRFGEHAVAKHYLAATVGDFPAGFTSTIDLPLCRGRKSRYRVAGPRDTITCSHQTYRVTQDREGLASLSRARRVRSTGARSLVAIKPLTGRTHQIRVHLAWIGYPIVGDHLYGKAGDVNQQANRLMLHCHKLAFPGYSFVAPPPQDLISAVD